MGKNIILTKIISVIVTICFIVTSTPAYALRPQSLGNLKTSVLPRSTGRTVAAQESIASQPNSWRITTGKTSVSKPPFGLFKSETARYFIISVLLAIALTFSSFADEAVQASWKIVELPPGQVSYFFDCMVPHFFKTIIALWWLWPFSISITIIVDLGIKPLLGKLLPNLSKDSTVYFLLTMIARLNPVAVMFIIFVSFFVMFPPYIFKDSAEIYLFDSRGEYAITGPVAAFHGTSEDGVHYALRANGDKKLTKVADIADSLAREKGIDCLVIDSCNSGNAEIGPVSIPVIHATSTVTTNIALLHNDGRSEKIWAKADLWNLILPDGTKIPLKEAIEKGVFKTPAELSDAFVRSHPNVYLEIAPWVSETYHMPTIFKDAEEALDYTRYNEVTGQLQILLRQAGDKLQVTIGATQIPQNLNPGTPEFREALIKAIEFERAVDLTAAPTEAELKKYGEPMQEVVVALTKKAPVISAATLSPAAKLDINKEADRNLTETIGSQA